MSAAEWLLVNGGDAQALLFFGGLVLFAGLERAIPRRPGSMQRRVRWPANFALTFIGLTALFAVPFSFIGAAAWARTQEVGLLNSVPVPVAASVVVTLAVRAFISFFTHWLNHKLPWLWRLHRVHHLDTELDVSSTFRVHPLEVLVTPFIGVPFVIAFGLSPWVLMAYELLDAAINVMTHSNLRIPEGVDRFLHYVVVTPDLHRVHHSSWQPETDSNFGAVFPIWDLVFGTFRPEPRDGHQAMELGLAEVRGPEAQRLLPLLASPLHRSL